MAEAYVMNYHEELINKVLIGLNENGVDNIDTIRFVLIRVIGEYNVSKKCTDIAVVDDWNERAVKLFLATKKIEGGSSATSKTRWYVIRKFSNFIGKDFREVNSFDILRWLASEQVKISLSTAESYRNIITSLFTWLFQNKMIAFNPAESIKPIKHPQSLKKPFTLVEVDALKFSCKTKLDRAMVEILLSTGIRCEELCNLRWGDINFITKDVNIIGGKGNKNRVTMMDDIAKKYLLEYKESLRFDSEYVFAVKYRGEIKQRSTDSVWQKLKIIGSRAGISEVNPHKFRHTFATTMYKRGLDVRMIQKLLGHSNINTTMIYIDNDIEMLRDAYKRCV